MSVVNVGVGITVTILLIFAFVILYKWVKRNRYKMPFNYTSQIGEDTRYPTAAQIEARNNYTTQVKHAQSNYDQRAIERGTYNAAKTITRIRTPRA